jgi:hypothetical protein
LTGNVGYMRQAVPWLCIRQALHTALRELVALRISYLCH